MKRRQELTPEVQAAVDDLMNGRTTNSTEEWLQRLYIRLLRREAAQKQQESNSKNNNLNNNNGNSANQNRTTE